MKRPIPRSPTGWRAWPASQRDKDTFGSDAIGAGLLPISEPLLKELRRGGAKVTVPLLAKATNSSAGQLRLIVQGVPPPPASRNPPPAPTTRHFSHQFVDRPRPIFFPLIWRCFADSHCFSHISFFVGLTPQVHLVAPGEFSEPATPHPPQQYQTPSPLAGYSSAGSPPRYISSPPVPEV